MLSINSKYNYFYIMLRHNIILPVSSIYRASRYDSSSKQILKDFKCYNYSNNCVKIGHDAFIKFDDLTMDKRIIDSKTVVLDKCCNVLSSLNGPLFPNTKNVIFNLCDKNFICEWLNKNTFPTYTNVFINSLYNKKLVDNVKSTDHDNLLTHVYSLNDWNYMYNKETVNNDMERLKDISPNCMNIVIENIVQSCDEIIYKYPTLEMK